MIERIIFTLVSFLLFAYIFLFKMMKKNDTTYLVLLLFQAIGILMNLIRVLFDALTGTASVVIMYLFSIISPIIVFYLEYKNINCSEWLQIALARMYILFSNERKAKEVLINIISKYDKSYTAHKLLAEIYEKEGGMRKAIDDYQMIEEGDKIAVALSGGKDSISLLYALKNLQLFYPKHFVPKPEF